MGYSTADVRHIPLHLRVHVVRGHDMAFLRQGGSFEPLCGAILVINSAFGQDKDNDDIGIKSVYVTMWEICKLRRKSRLARTSTDYSACQ